MEEVLYENGDLRISAHGGPQRNRRVRITIGDERVELTIPEALDAAATLLSDLPCGHCGHTPGYNTHICRACGHEL